MILLTYVRNTVSGQSLYSFQLRTAVNEHCTTLLVIAALSALIHARLHGCAWISCPEQNQTANPNCLLIVNRI